MRANIKYRICLRVEAVDTSREMLRRSDAAFLPSGMPGRGYLQVGNENIELMQVAYTGENYPYADAAGGRPAAQVLRCDCRSVQRLAGRGRSPRPRTPWPPFLAHAPDPGRSAERRLSGRRCTVPLITLGQAQPAPLGAQPLLQAVARRRRATGPASTGSKTAMRGIAGLLDDPYNARQMPLVVDFSKGHAVLFGASGYGKTTFIRTLITSLACYSLARRVPGPRAGPGRPQPGGADRAAARRHGDLARRGRLRGAGAATAARAERHRGSAQAQVRRGRRLDAVRVQQPGRPADRAGHPVGRRQLRRVHRDVRQPQRRR